MTFTDLLAAGFRNSICYPPPSLHPKNETSLLASDLLGSRQVFTAASRPSAPPPPHPALAGGYLLILLESLQGAIWSCFLLLANKLFTCRTRSAEYKLGYSLPGIMQSGGHGGEEKKECGVIKSPSRAFLRLTAIKMLFFYWLTSCWGETFNYHFRRAAVMRSPPSEAVIEPGVLLRLTLLNSQVFFFLGGLVRSHWLRGPPELMTRAEARETLCLFIAAANQEQQTECCYWPFMRDFSTRPWKNKIHLFFSNRWKF